MATWEPNVVAGGIRFPQAWPVAQAESFPSCVCISFFALWLQGIWRSERGEDREWRGGWIAIFPLKIFHWASTYLHLD